MRHVWNDSWIENDDVGMDLTWDMNESWSKGWHEIYMH